MKAKEFYNVAIYLRLSRDDEDIDGSKTESNSISSQRDMIRGFIRKQDDMEIYDIYVDDGYSGANFDRPEFKRMMKDVEAGNVDCVIVKDLSRLGRDYIEAGRLIQKTFPAFSVRFIALTDHFDSLTADYNETSLVVPVKNFVNDSYSRDISGKVRSHQKIKRENGDFIGAFAVYGYKKCEDNRNQLVPDDYAADIVRKIFAWKIEGYSNLAIANRLDNLGILSPMEYKKMKGDKFQTGFVTGVKAKWSAVAVKRILSNENYIGTLVQGKEEKVNYKVKKSVKKPEEEWTKVPDAHEAIISKEDFEIVQDLLMIDTRAGGGEEKAHIYAGLLFCGDCMEPMIRRVNRYKGKETVSFICSTKNKSGECSRHTISEAALNQLVLTGLRTQVSLFLNKSRVLRSIEQMEVNFEEVVAFDKEIERLHSEQDKYLGLRAGLYEDLKKQIITEEDFKNFREIYEKRYQELQQAISNQEETIKRLFKSGVTAGINLERMKTVMQVTELDRMTLVSLVKRILVYEDKRVYLELRSKELFSKVLMLAGYVETLGQSRGEAV
ncbi:MAG: recombinase family protein [Lachnospiraceae bacterium]|nr:recombinase family protein [Lachnospiraceae bacterium]